MHGSKSAGEHAGRLALVALALSAAACSGDDASEIDAAEAVAIASAHADDVDAFERWARRIAASDTTFPSRAALEEAAFAPVRRQDGVEAAWIERVGPDPWTLSHPRRAVVPAELGWRRARLGGLREYEVSRSGTRHYVRARTETTGGAMLVVTLAIEPEPASP